MKKFFFTLFILISYGVVCAQDLGNLVIFSERGHRFIVVLNGIKQSEQYQTNVKITGLNAEYYKAKILYENKSLAQSNFNIMCKPGYEVTYCLKPNKKGKMVLRFQSEAPLSAPLVYGSNPPVVMPYNNGSAPGNQSVSNGGTINNNNVNINLNVGNTNVGNTANSGNAPGNAGAPQVPPQPISTCGMPMTNNDFMAAKQTILSQSFEDTKLKVAKQVAGSNCLLASQIKQIMETFDFEQSRLDFAKFAYPKCGDRNNYYLVNDVFQFSSSVDDLTRYISTVK